MKKLTAKQQELAERLADGTNVAKAAKALGIPETTASRWHRLEHVRNRVRLLQTDKLERLAGTAVGVLERCLTDPETPHNIRLKAAIEVLNRAGLASEAPNAPAFNLHIDLSTPSTPHRVYDAQPRDADQLDLLDSSEGPG